MEKEPYSREMVDEKFQRVLDAVQNIKEGQDKFHLEVKAEFTELKTNSVKRLSDVEDRVSSLETARNIGLGVCILAGVCASLIVYIYIHDQESQNATIQRIESSQQK